MVNDANPDHGTTGGNNTSDKIFFLSIAEVRSTLFADNAARISVNTDYTSSKGNPTAPLLGGSADYWWLRSPGANAQNVAIVGDLGQISAAGMMMVINSRPLRPALKLDLASVIFASDASGTSAKSSVAIGGGLAPAAALGANLKLTVADAALATGTLTPTAVSGRTVTFGYTGATAANALSAIVKNSGGTVNYYGKLVAAASNTGTGSTSILLPDDFAAGDTLQIFLEQVNGDKETDFASTPVTLAVAAQTAPASLAGVACTTTANSNGQITGTTAAMEYSTNGTTWAPCTASPITSLAPGSYQVRFASKMNGIQAILASPATAVTVEAYLAAPTVASITAPAAVNVGQTLNLTVPAISENGAAITAQGWQISADGSTGWVDFDSAITITATHNGQTLRYAATNSAGTTTSNTVQIAVNPPTPTTPQTTAPTVGSPQTGDNANMGLWVAMLGLSIAGGGLAARGLRRGKRMKR